MGCRAKPLIRRNKEKYVALQIIICLLPAAIAASAE